MADPNLAWQQPYQTEGQTPIDDVVRDDANQRIIYDGNRVLLRIFGFVRGVENFSANQQWRYTFLQSPRFPNSRLLSYRRMRSTLPHGHLVAIITRGHIVEYYDSEGRTAEQFPDDIIQAITGGRVLEDAVTNIHQLNNTLCARYALYRATFGRQNTNALYNEMLITMRDQYRLPSFADVIWNSSQNTLATIGEDALVI